MKTLLNASILVVVILLVGCTGSSDSGGGQQPVNTGDNTNNNSGGSSGNNSSPSPGAGTGDSGAGSGDDSNSSGGESSSPSPAPGTLASLYSAQNVSLSFLNCNSIASPIDTVYFDQAVMRVLTQVNNDVTAVLTLTPTDQSLIDQIVLSLSGAFSAEDTVEGSFSALATLNGQVVDSTDGTFIVTVYYDETLMQTTLNIEIVATTNLNQCGIIGSFDLNEATDPGADGGNTGGGSGGSDTGGDTGGGSGGGDTGGGTGGGNTGGNTGGGSNNGELIVATGQFGSLQMQSQEFPEDNGTFEMTKIQFVNIPGMEMFAWTNDQQATVNIFFGQANSNTTHDSINSRDYLCDCFPTVDLINNQVIFTNLVLFKTTSPTGSITLNGTLTFPRAN